MSFCEAKYGVLVLLVVQNTCLVLLMRYSRTRPGTMYLGSTAVCCDEALKWVTCFCILAVAYVRDKRKLGEGGGRYSKLSTGADEEENDNAAMENEADATIVETHIRHASFRSYLGEELQFDFRMAGIAAIYTVQKNLLYLAISNLDAAVFQVTYQAKILTTAVFSVVLLKRTLSSQKIGGLLLLTLGVALVQLDKVEENASASYQEQRRWIGVLAVLGACCTSGFAGVYFELVLKPRTAQAGRPRPPPCVWAKNIQLSTFAFAIALVTAFLKDHRAILADGFFQGYSPLVLLVITFEAFGGLVVAIVIKYADNILKSFATAVSIVTSTVVSAWVFGFVISKLFVGGCLCVFVAIGLYSREDDTSDRGPAAAAASRAPQTPDIAMTSLATQTGTGREGVSRVL